MYYCDLGIGLICAKDFARRGANVVMVCRDMTKAEKAKNEIVGVTGNRNIKVDILKMLLKTFYKRYLFVVETYRFYIVCKCAKMCCGNSSGRTVYTYFVE